MFNRKIHHQWLFSILVAMFNYQRVSVLQMSMTETYFSILALHSAIWLQAHSQHINLPPLIGQEILGPGLVEPDRVSRQPHLFKLLQIRISGCYSGPSLLPPSNVVRIFGEGNTTNNLGLSTILSWSIMHFWCSMPLSASTEKSTSWCNFWLLLWNSFYVSFHYLGNLIIPMDELIFFGGVGKPATSLHFLLSHLFPHAHQVMFGDYLSTDG